MDGMKLSIYCSSMETTPRKQWNEIGGRGVHL